MKKLIVLITAFFFCSNAFCQYDTTPPYLKDKILPQFNLLNVDSAQIYNSLLATGKSTIIMLYNPDCGHCQEQMKLLLSLKEITAGNTQILLVSTQPIFKIKEFVKKFKLRKYSNIIVAKDYKWFFGKYFQPKTIPVLAFYNKQNQFVLLSQGNVSKQQILDAIK
jgi:thiol-disulfide isomerase/thioredoxin